MSGDAALRRPKCGSPRERPSHDEVSQTSTHLADEVVEAVDDACRRLVAAQVRRELQRRQRAHHQVRRRRLRAPRTRASQRSALLETTATGRSQQDATCARVSLGLHRGAGCTGGRAGGRQGWHGGACVCRLETGEGGALNLAVEQQLCGPEDARRDGLGQRRQLAGVQVGHVQQVVVPCRGRRAALFLHGRPHTQRRGALGSGQVGRRLSACAGRARAAAAPLLCRRTCPDERHDRLVRQGGDQGAVGVEVHVQAEDPGLRGRGRWRGAGRAARKAMYALSRLGERGMGRGTRHTWSSTVGMSVVTDHDVLRHALEPGRRAGAATGLSTARRVSCRAGDNPLPHLPRPG